MLLTAQIYPYVILGQVLLVALSIAVTFLFLYVTVRIAVRHSLRAHEAWLQSRPPQQ